MMEAAHAAALLAAVVAEEVLESDLLVVVPVEASVTMFLPPLVSCPLLRVLMPLLGTRARGHRLKHMRVLALALPAVQFL